MIVTNSDGDRMGRYKEYREPKRRGYGDDCAPQDRAAERRPSNSRPSAAQASEPVAAIVKWFNAEKGFGFVAVVGGSEAFMHIRQLEAGHSSVSVEDQGNHGDRVIIDRWRRGLWALSLPEALEPVRRQRGIAHR